MTESHPDYASWQWLPGRSLGPVRFGQPLGSLLDEHSLDLVEPPYPEADWETYVSPDGGQEIHVKCGVVDTVGCFRCLNYRGLNIIGLTVEEMYALLGHPSEILAPTEGGVPYEYDLHFASIYIENGVVASAICYGSDSSSDAD